MEDTAVIDPGVNVNTEVPERTLKSVANNLKV